MLLYHKGFKISYPMEGTVNETIAINLGVKFCLNPGDIFEVYNGFYELTSSWEWNGKIAVKLESEK